MTSSKKEITLARNRIKNAIKKLNKGWTPVFNHTVNYSVYLVIDRDYRLAVDSSKTIKMQPTWMYLKSRELANQLIENYREDLIKILSQ